MPSFRRHLVSTFATTAALCLLSAAPALAKPCADQNAMPEQGNVTQIRKATLCLLNKERGRRHRTALRANGELRDAAQAYAVQMVDQSFFAHVSPAGTTLLSRIGKSTDYLVDTVRYTLGENLAWGSGERATPRQTVIAWMASTDHRRNVLDPSFRQIGIGVAIGAPTDTQGQPAATYTTEFGRRTTR